MRGDRRLRTCATTKCCGRRPPARRNSRAPRGFFPERWQPSGQRRNVADAWLFVPEGHRRKLAGGKPAPAGAAPGGHAERAMPQRGIGEVFGVGRPAASPPSLVTSDRSGRQRSAPIPGHFFDAPLGHGATRHGFRGRRPRARTGPRLISSGVPPGRKPGGRALPKGNHRRGNYASNSFGWGSAALGSSCLRGLLGVFPCIDTAWCLDHLILSLSFVL